MHRKATMHIYFSWVHWMNINTTSETPSHKALDEIPTLDFESILNNIDIIASMEKREAEH